MARTTRPLLSVLAAVAALGLPACGGDGPADGSRGPAGASASVAPAPAPAPSANGLAAEQEAAAAEAARIAAEQAAATEAAAAAEAARGATAVASRPAPQNSSAPRPVPAPAPALAPAPAPRPQVDSWVSLSGKSCNVDGDTYTLGFTVHWSDGHTMRVDRYVSGGPYLMNLYTDYAGENLWTVRPADQGFSC